MRCFEWGSVVEYLPVMHKALGSIPSTIKKQTPIKAGIGRTLESRPPAVSTAGEGKWASCSQRLPLLGGWQSTETLASPAPAPVTWADYAYQRLGT